MSLGAPNFVYLALLFVALLFAGFWLSRLGQPYHSAVFNLHKLIGLGLGIWLVKIVYERQQVLALEASQISVLVFTVTLFAITVIAGGLLSVQSAGGLKSFPPVAWVGIQRVHQFLPCLILIATALTLYRLFQ